MIVEPTKTVAHDGSVPFMIHDGTILAFSWCFKHYSPVLTHDFGNADEDEEGDVDEQPAVVMASAVASARFDYHICSYTFHF